MLLRTIHGKWLLLTGVTAMVMAFGWRYRLVVIGGSSMQPALRDRQVAVMDRDAAASGTLRRGDIVVFRHGRDTYVKRVYALPGDTVRMAHFSNGSNWLVGDPLFSLDKVRRLARRHPDAVRFYRAIVPAGTVYVLGDNRLCSVDSRSFGAISASSIIGRIVSPAQLIASIPSHFGNMAARLTASNSPEIL